MTDVLRQLSVASWRGIDFPITNRSAGFEHDNARHKFVFRDGELVESLGGRNFTYQYVVPFREGISKGPYRNLFTTVFPAFLEAFEDREEGELYDPIHGPVICRPGSWQEETDINRRDGQDVSLSFIRSPSDDDSERLGAPLAGIEGARQEGLRLDSEIAKISDAQLVTAGLFDLDGPSGVDVLDLVSGVGFQVAAQAKRIDAAVNKFAAKIEKIEAAMDAINAQAGTPGQAPIIRSARRLRDSTTRLDAKARNPGKNIQTTIVGQDTPAGALAQQLGMSLPEFLSLNAAVSLPLVLKGTTVSFFA